MKHIPEYFTQSNVSRETLDKLFLYEELLTKWQKSINLVSNATINTIWERHFLDSAQLYDHIDNPEASILDIGSGGGFPAIILAILGINNIHVAESDKRKCIFLKEITRQCKLNTTIHNTRIEALEPRPYDIITSRACASLDTLIHYAEPFLSKNTYCLFPKGQNYTKEIGEALLKWNFDYELFPSLSDTSARIIKIHNISRR